MLSRPRQCGFTLVEAVIAMALLGILATLAVAALEGPLRKSRRAEALAALASAQLNQEMRRSNEAEYDPSLEVALLQASRAHEHYAFVADLPVGGSASSSYRLVATARESSSQSRDQGCQVLGLEVLNGDVRRLAGTTSATAARGSAAEACWGRS